MDVEWGVLSFSHSRNNAVADINVTSYCGIDALSGFAVQAGGPRMFGFYADLTAILAVTLLADGHSAALLPLGGAAALEGFQRAMRMSGAAKGKTEE